MRELLLSRARTRARLCVFEFLKMHSSIHATFALLFMHTNLCDASIYIQLSSKNLNLYILNRRGGELVSPVG